MNLKCISLWQPFATLIFTPSIHVPGRMAKENETRGWTTSYRGLLGIHATAGFPKECKALLSESQFIDHLQTAALPKGAILGTVELVSIQSTERYLQSIDQNRGITHEQAKALVGELRFGDYTDGRYTWKLQNAKLFPEPIPAKGKQGFWNFDLPAKYL